MHQQITKPQLIQLHTLLQKQNLMPRKADMVAGVTQGRTESSKELSQAEASLLIEQLQPPSPPRLWQPKEGETMRKKIIAIAHNMRWEVPNPKGGLPKADMKRINDWCLLQQPKKRLNDCNMQELTLLVSIFETKVYKQFLKAI